MEDPTEPGHDLLSRVRGNGYASLIPRVTDGVGIAEILDGTSNTIVVVEAKEAVPWTKPASDLPFDDDQKVRRRSRRMLDAWAGTSSGGFNALFCDGAVRFIRSTIALPVFRALITRARAK